jgi:hypothetical protein
MQAGPAVGAQANYVASIGRDFGLIQKNIEHDFSNCGFSNNDFTNKAGSKGRYCRGVEGKNKGSKESEWSCELSITD